MPKVLIADDNSNIQKMATLALKDQGFEVVGVSNGEAAVKKLPDVMPDVVLADVFMPVRNGYEVCEFVKNDPRFAHVPVVLLVGAFDPVDEHEVQRVRADNVLQKPFVPPDPLIAMVRQMAEKSAAARPAGAASASKVESTVKLSKEELAALTGAPPPPSEPEPEIHDYAVRAEPIKMSETDQPLAFGDLLGPPAVEEEPKKEPEPEGFVASSIEHVEVPAEEEETQEAAAAPEVPNWGGIESPPREPSPDEPPIKVEFGEPEPMELITDESQAASSPSLEIAAPAELASSPDDFMAAAPPPAITPEPPPIDLLAHEEPPPPAPAPARAEDDISLMDTQEVRDFKPPVPPPPVAEPLPPPPVMAASAPAGPQMLDAAAVEAAVEKVLSRIQPQLLDRITRDVLRPVIEQLLRKELEK